MADFARTAELFDFQVNGFAGIDFQSSDLTLDDMVKAVEALRRHSTTGILFTLITDRVDSLCRKLERIESLRRTDERVASVVRGYHVEGPWISTEPGYFGAHPVHLACKPTLADYRRLSEAAQGNLKLITLAPEVDGCLQVTEAATKDGVRISLGHTNASEMEIDAAIEAGATLATHVGNAVPLMLHRHDNIIQRLLARDELIACLIPDGLHLPPSALKNFFRSKPSGCVFFTTDCMAAAAAPPGRYTIGPHTVEVSSDGIVRLPGEKRFAGSSLTLEKGVDNVVNWLGLDYETAVGICSTLPARHFGCDL
ncbi:MAG: N-acetylglucosamine-6-phosphate deacetylase [Rhodothermales bacterium]|nr:N-acetylglucosamine-6-phosphate deacetylase [Rhodothermales bacterium]